MKSNLPDFSSKRLFASDCILSPTNGGRPLWWWVFPACKDQGDHQPPGSSYVSDTLLFGHE